jgi:hypothetical protein
MAVYQRTFMDEIERAAIRDEGMPPHDPKVVAALDQVRAEMRGAFNWGV